MSVMSAAEAGQTGDAGHDLPVSRRRLRVAAPVPEADRENGPDSLFGTGSGTPSGADAGRPWLADAEVRSTELRVREVRVVRRASTVRRGAGLVQAPAGAVKGRAGVVTQQASEVAARASTVTRTAQTRTAQSRAAAYAPATGPAATGVPGATGVTRTRIATQRRTVTQARITATTRTATRRPQRPGAIRLTRRGRLVVAGFAMLMVVVAATALWMTMAGSVQASSQRGAAASPYQGMTQVVVRPGQTLWSIAAAAEPSANTWAVIQQITEVNALNGAAVHPGQLLWVPKG